MSEKETIIIDNKSIIKNDYQNNGFAFFPNLFNDEILDKYKYLSTSAHAEDQKYYLSDSKIRDIFCSQEIYNVINTIGITVALSTGSFFDSTTERGWHRDHVWPYKVGADNYIGVWIAGEDVSSESGPFELIPGSHKWEIDYSNFEGDLLYKKFDQLVNVFEEKRKEKKSPIFSFHISKGDAIFWHGHTVHRGASAKNAALTRRSFIAHYCNTKLHGSIDDELLNFPEMFKKHGAGYFFVE